MFEAVWQTYHNKKVDLIFGYVVQFGINFAKMDVKGGKMQNRSICIALPNNALYKDFRGGHKNSQKTRQIRKCPTVGTQQGIPPG